MLAGSDDQEVCFVLLGERVETRPTDGAPTAISSAVTPVSSRSASSRRIASACAVA
ncbi:MAG TPA: hypothetical protein VIJ51_17050 [Solirubrobacteraceae bacterium]